MITNIVFHVPNKMQKEGNRCNFV